MAGNDARKRKEDLGLEPREADPRAGASPLCWNPFSMHILLLKKKKSVDKKERAEGKGGKEGERKEGRREIRGVQ